MSFHKVIPVRKNRKPAAPAAAKKASRKAPEKAAPKRRPISHKG